MPELMKSQIFYEPEKMQLEEKAIPTPKSDDVLIKVKSVGICGSDVAYYFGNSSLETSDGKPSQKVEFRLEIVSSLTLFSQTQIPIGARKVYQTCATKSVY